VGHLVQPSLQPLNVLLVVRHPKLNTAFKVHPHPCRVQGHNHFPTPEFILQLFPGGRYAAEGGIENTRQIAPELVEWDGPYHGQMQGYAAPKDHFRYTSSPRWNGWSCKIVVCATRTLLHPPMLTWSLFQHSPSLCTGLREDIAS